MISSESKDETIGVLESLQAVCNAKADMSIGKGKILWAGYGKATGDAIAFLKEQEPVRPIHEDGYYLCGSCKAYVAFPNGDCKKSFCEKCGKPVLWEGW